MLTKKLGVRAAELTLENLGLTSKILGSTLEVFEHGCLLFLAMALRDQLFCKSFQNTSSTFSNFKNCSSRFLHASLTFPTH